MSSPSGVRGGVPVAIAFSAYFRPQTLLVARKIRVSCPKAVVTVTTTFKSGGDKSLSSRTKLRLCRVAGEGRRVVAPPCPRSTARLKSSPVGRVESFRSWSSHLFRGRPGGRRHVRSGGRLNDHHHGRVAGEGRRVVAPPYPQHASRALQWDGWNRFVAGRATCSVDDATLDVDTRAAEKSLQFFVSYRIKLVSSTSFG